MVETKEFSPNQFFFKVRAELTEGSRLQVRMTDLSGHTACPPCEI